MLPGLWYWRGVGKGRLRFPTERRQCSRQCWGAGLPLPAKVSLPPLGFVTGEVGWRTIARELCKPPAQASEMGEASHSTPCGLFTPCGIQNSLQGWWTHRNTGQWSCPQGSHLNSHVIGETNPKSVVIICQTNNFAGPEHFPLKTKLFHFPPNAAVTSAPHWDPSMKGVKE